MGWRGVSQGKAQAEVQSECNCVLTLIVVGGQRRYEAVDLCQSVANEGSVVAE